MPEPTTMTRPPSVAVAPGPSPIEAPDLSEKGGIKDGRRQTLDRRLYMQLLAWGACDDAEPLISALRASGMDAVLYADVNDPQGVGLLTVSEDPDVFVGPLRRLLQDPAFRALTLKPEFTMLGRTYALGYEPDLEDALIQRPRRTVLEPAWPWAIWYPLRRSGQFARLEESEQREILKEHGTIGMRFGRADLAHDIRLACHGLDKHDNDFVIGVLGKELHPLSAVVQTMRGTQQTALYLTNLGPFFVGKAMYQAGI
jgi:chlorite dismutase